MNNELLNEKMLENFATQKGDANFDTSPNFNASVYVFHHLRCEIIKDFNTFTSLL
jgi:hypothetical protein